MKKLLGLFAAVLALQPATAYAQDSEAPSLTFNGYGTLGIVHSDEEQADFTSNFLAPDGAGYSRQWSAEVDSRLALQATADLTPRLAAIVQVVAEQRYDETYEPTLEWANLRYRLTPDLTLRVGRMVLPTFLTSEFRKVGYALPWVRPPPELYRLVPVTSTDGVSASYRWRFDGFTNTLKGVYGRKTEKFPGSGEPFEVDAEKAFTLANTLEWGRTTLFASYNHTHLTFEDFNPFFDAFRQFGPAGAAIADRYNVDDKAFEFIALGGRYDPGSWFVMGEWSTSDSRTFLGEARAWYVTGGVRAGAFTPYATFARAGTASATSDPGLDTASLPPAAAAQAGQLNSALDMLLNSTARQKRLAVGVRWDFMRNAALKVQYDHIDLDEGSAGVLVNTQPGFQPGGSVNLFSLVVDFVF